MNYGLDSGGIQMKRRHFIVASGFGALAARAPDFQTSASNKPRWQPDGAGRLTTIGVLTPQGDARPESEIKAMAPDGVAVHSSIVHWLHDPSRTDNFRRFLDPPHLDNAAELLSSFAPSSVILGFSSTSYIDGPSGDPRLVARLEKATKGIPVILPTLAFAEALRFLHIRRIAIVHPPWFSEETNLMGRDYFQKVGFEVVSCMRIGPSRRLSELSPAEVYEWVVANVHSRAEAVVLSGNGARTIGAINALEKRLKRPVLTANQVPLWSALRRIGLASRVRTYGRVFTAS